VSENVERIWIIGSKNAINLSSPLRNLLKACAWIRKRFETASGFWQVSSCVAKGCVLRDFPVKVWYSFSAALNIAVKFSAEGSAVGLFVDIVIWRGNWEVRKSCMKMVGGGNRLSHNKTQPQRQTDTFSRNGIEMERRNRDSPGGDIHYSLEEGPDSLLGVVSPEQRPMHRCIKAVLGEMISYVEKQCVLVREDLDFGRALCGKLTMSNGIAVMDGSRVMGATVLQ
jgi:hypothetical protein